MCGCCASYPTHACADEGACTGAHACCSTDNGTTAGTDRCSGEGTVARRVTTAAKGGE